MSATSLSGHIFDTLSRVNVNERTEKKGKLTYLSWAWAYQTLMEYYPDNSYKLWEEFYDNGQVMVHCEMTIRVGEETVSRYMWLPVLNSSNKPIIKPDVFQINTSRMRCLTKCISMFGLGAYIYAGEDMPDASHDPVEEVPPALISIEQVTLLAEALEYSGRSKDKLLSFYGVKDLDELTVPMFEQAYNGLLKQIAKNAATEQGAE